MEWLKLGRKITRRGYPLLGGMVAATPNDSLRFDLSDVFRCGINPESIYNEIVRSNPRTVNEKLKSLAEKYATKLLDANLVVPIISDIMSKIA